MSNRTDQDCINDIQKAIYRISEYTVDITYSTFLQDIKTQDAVIRNLEIIGEATKKLSNKLRNYYSSVPWKSMAGLRDRLIHEYFGINIDIVWQIVAEELPRLSLQLEKIANELNQ